MRLLRQGVRKRRCIFENTGGSNPAVTHRHENAALGHEQYENDRAVAHKNGQHYGFVKPGKVGDNRAVACNRPHVVDGDGYGSDTFLSGKFAIVGYACHDMGKHHVEDSADEQREEYAQRHVAFGVPRFLCGGAHCIEAEKGEEYDGGASQYAAPAVLAYLAGIVGKIRRVVGRVDIAPAEEYENKYDGYLEQYNDIVDEGNSRGCRV